MKERALPRGLEQCRSLENSIMVKCHFVTLSFQLPQKNTPKNRPYFLPIFFWTDRALHYRCVYFDDDGGGRFILIWIVLVCRYSFRPCDPPSRPMPLCLNPPNGVCGDALKAELMLTVPASTLLATRKARPMSEVKIVARVCSLSAGDLPNQR